MKVTYAVLLALLLAVAVFFEACDAQGGAAGRRRRRNRRRRNRNRNRGGGPIVPAPPQDCGAIPHLDNAQALHTPDGVHYACQPGYRLEGTNTITCIDGRWTVAPRCVRQICPTPPLIAFANAPQLSASGTSVTYTCQSGYRIVNGGGATSQTLSCNVALRSWPALPACEAAPTQSCGAPPAIANGASQQSGDTATYTCNAGYIQQSGTPSQITCSGTTWVYSTLPACINDPSTTTPAPKCLRSPPCGGSTIMRGDVADSYDVGNKITYTCITGYRIVGQANTVNTAEVECTSAGTWSAVPTCEPVQCGPITFAANGNTQAIAATAVTYNSQYTYQCIDLYTTTAATVATCLANGQWSITPPTCTIRTCTYASLPTLTNGSPYGVTVNADIPVGTNVTYQCSSGYRIAPSTATETGVLQQIQCLSTGAWSAFTYSCVYQYPSSCKDYYNRDNLFAAATIGSTVDVRIDTDGATATNSDSLVTCFKKSATEVGTRVTPNSGTTAVGAAACPGVNSPILFGVTFDNDETDFPNGVCETNNVGYPLNANEITALLTSSQNCFQQISSTCAGLNPAAPLAPDANFIAVLQNGFTRGVAYGAGSTGVQVQGVGPGNFDAASLLNLNGVSRPCDCVEAGTCTGCQCSTNAARPNGADTITIALSGTNPHYVTSYARVAQDVSGGGGPAVPPAGLTAGELDVTIGPIECCETF